MTGGIVHWRSAATELEQVLRRHGLDPAKVSDVDTAWLAFCEFAQIELAGVDPRPDTDADGLIVQWGRYSWNQDKLGLIFTRQVAVVDDDPDGDPADPDPDPVLWQVSLVVLFDDDPDLLLLAETRPAHTGFFFEPLGAPRDAVLREIGSYPQLQAALGSRPSASRIDLDATD